MKVRVRTRVRVRVRVRVDLLGCCEPAQLDDGAVDHVDRSAVQARSDKVVPSYLTSSYPILFYLILAYLILSYPVCCYLVYFHLIICYHT